MTKLMTQSNRPTRCPHPVNNQRQDPAEDLPVQGSALRLGVRDSQRWEIQKSAFRRGKPPQPDALAPDDRVARLPGPVRRTRACGAAGTAPTHPRGLDAGAVAVLVGGGSGSIVPGPVPGKGMGSARVAAFQVLYSYVLRQALQRPRQVVFQAGRDRRALVRRSRTRVHGVERFGPACRGLPA